MNKVDIIEITKDFEAEAVVNAVKAYLTPKNETLRMESGCIGGEYIVKLLAPTKVKEKKNVRVTWVERCSVKLSFDLEICRVNTYIEYTTSAALLGAGIGFGVAGFIFPVGFLAGAVATGASAVTVGVEKHNANKLRKDIIKIVSSFITDKNIEVEDIELEELQDKKIKKEKDTKTGAVCSCGNKLADDAMFCPKCGKPRDNGMRICSCGKQIKSDMNFCPYCGEKAE